MSARFEVHSVTGYTIGSEGRNAGKKQKATYWICDLEGYPKQVATFAPRSGFRSSDAIRKRRADALCARMNAEYDEWLRREGLA